MLCRVLGFRARIGVIGLNRDFIKLNLDNVHLDGT